MVTGCNDHDRDVSNNDLKHRLDALCFEFTGMLEDETNFPTARRCTPTVQNRRTRT
jgi:hypothetical protein